MRGKRLVEVLKVVDLMSREQGVSNREIMDALGKEDRKAAQRVRESVEALGFPVYEDKQTGEPFKRWKLDQEYVRKLPNLNVPNISLSLSEVIALQFVRSHVDIFEGTELERALSNVFSRLNMFVPDHVAEKLNRLNSLFVSANRFGKDYKGKEEVIDTLVGAMLEQKTCLVRYFSFSKNRITEFSIDPLHFFEHRLGLYLFMRSTKYRNIRVLAVERIEEVEVLGETFDYPKDFSPDAYLDSAFDLTFEDPVLVSVKIAASHAKYIKERRFFQDQTIIEQEDGSILLTMQASGRKDIKKWVMSLGRSAELLEPVELRREIAEELERAAGVYRE